MYNIEKYNNLTFYNLLYISILLYNMDDEQITDQNQGYMPEEEVDIYIQKTKKADKRSITSLANAEKARQTRAIKNKIKKDLEVKALKQQEKEYAELQQLKLQREALALSRAQKKTVTYQEEEEDSGSEEEIIYVKPRSSKRVVARKKPDNSEVEELKKEIALLKEQRIEAPKAEPKANSNEVIAEHMRKKILNF
jgi:hypothetical protein